MNLSFNKILILIVVVFSVANCAKRGRPTGGEKDLTAPILISASPSYESTNFDAKKIKIYFDEYIKLKNVNRQLIVSPPLKNTLDITPVGTASKIITIKVLDTLKENTTYTFNFGNSVEDNNEGNPLKSFKYVFSTGDFIDSLKISGDIADAFSRKTDSDILMMLYEIDSIYNDSIIYKNKPTYVSSTLDSTNFSLTNLKEGKYIGVALKQPNNNYIYNPKQDKIGFVQDTISLPGDTIFNISIFKEVLPFKFIKGLETSKGHLIFGYEGNGKDLNIKLLDRDLADTLKSETVFEKEKDTLSFWYKPFERDSLIFEVSHLNFIDTVTVKLKTSKQDTLILSNSIGSFLSPKDTFAINSNIPIVQFDTTKFTIFDKDTVAIPLSVKLDPFKRSLSVIFDSQYDNKYAISVLPNGIYDIFESTNDTLNFTLRTKKLEDFGIVNLQISEVNSPVIIQLITENDEEVVAAQKIMSNQTITFKDLEPKKYIARAIIDENDNGIWDTGNFLLRKQPEKVIYYDKLIEVRANWDWNDSPFILK